MFHYETVTDPVSLWRRFAISAIRWGSASRLALIRRLAVTARVAPYPAVNRARAHFVEQVEGGPGRSRAGGTGRGRHVYLVGGDMQSTPRRLVPIILGALVALPALLVAQEPVTITGKVTSDAGQPLAQVEVAIPTMGLGALTKDDGRFVVVVPGARVSGQTVTLVARRLGYRSQTAQVTLSSGGVTHDFVLAANPLQLGEVVVTGAGTSSSAEKLGSVRNSVDSTLIQ